jgi:hypothetical protein
MTTNEFAVLNAFNTFKRVTGGVKITSRIQIVTPALAEAWLKLNMDNQRSPSERKIRRLAGLMLAGKWLIATSIDFDWNGRMINGQNRLRAVILAGIPVDFLIIEGYDPAASGVLDQSSRSGREVLQIVSRDQNGKYGNVKMAAAQDDFRYEAGMLNKVYYGNGGGQFELVDKAEWVLDNRDTLDYYSPIASSLPSKLGCAVKPSPALYVFTRLHQIDSIKTKEFSAWLQSSARSGDRDARYAFKAAYLRTPKLQHDQDIALLFLLWNDWITGNAEDRGVYRAPLFQIGADMPVPLSPVGGVRG